MFLVRSSYNHFKQFSKILKDKSFKINIYRELGTETNSVMYMDSTFSQLA